MGKLDIFNLLFKYNDDLYRNDLSTYDFLSNHFKTYINDYKLAINNSRQILGCHYEAFENVFYKIKACADSVCDVLREIHNNNLNSSIHTIYALFDENKDYLPLITKLYTEEFYHVRRETDFNFEDRLQMFHISNNNKSIISAHRYNSSGEPCWYLANDLYLCWLECGLPNEFAWCKVKSKKEHSLKVVDFLRWGLDSLYLLKGDFFSREEAKITNSTNEILKYYITYPIFAACSLRVKNRNVKYVTEYAFPQLFMRWLKDNTDFDGIAYSSELYCDLFKGKCHKGNPIFNIAIANREFEDGYDKETAKKYVMSSIERISAEKEIRNSNIKELEGKCTFLINKIDAELFVNVNVDNEILSLYMQIKSICKSIKQLCKLIIDSKDYNSIVIFSDEICMHAELISDRYKCIDDEIMDMYNKIIKIEIMPFKTKCNTIFSLIDAKEKTFSDIF